MRQQETAQDELDLMPGNVKQIVAPYRQGSVDIYMVTLDAVRLRPGFNDARESDPDYEAHIRELADSIKANGFYRHKPLTVFAAADGFLYLSDGHSRYQAALLANDEGAGIEAIPVVNEVKGTTDEDRLIGLITNNSGKRLTPYGEGMVCKKLIGRGLSEKEIARRTGFPTQKVSNLLSLIGAPKPIRDMVTTGKVSATTAIKTMRQHGTGAIAALESGVKKADAAGKAKVMPRMVEPSKSGKAKPGKHEDTERLDWIAESGGVVIRERHQVGGEHYFEVLDRNENARLGEGPNVRAAIDDAMARK